MFVSATPSKYELEKSTLVADQLIRPTGLLDPLVEVLPSKNQIDNLIGKIEERVAKKQRVLVTTLTKKMSEDLAEYLREAGIKVKYLHSDIDAIERVEILRDLRLGLFDCLVGINLLREGIDLPEVSLVAVLDADKEGFLRSETSLIQVAGRAARHQDGHVIFYADHITDSMRKMMTESARRRKLQIEYNTKHGITPLSIQKEVRDGLESIKKARELVLEVSGVADKKQDILEVISELEREMEEAARLLQFEKAIQLRDELRKLQGKLEKSDPRKDEKPAPKLKLKKK